jgi:proline dehydrogenase
MDVDDIVSELRTLEERLRDLAYDRLREAAAGDTDAAADEKRLLQARRAVERAIRALGGVPEEL